MIVGFHGPERSGKTLMATYHALLEATKGRQIYSNYAIYFDRHTCGNMFGRYPHIISMLEEHPPKQLDLAKLILSNNDLTDCTIIVDEAQQWFDCRSSGSIFNKIASYLAYQTEKQGTDMYVCVHDPRFIDWRLRSNIKLAYFCQWVGDPYHPNPDRDSVYWTRLDTRTMPVSVVKRYTLASPIYPMFNSSKRVPIDPTLKDKIQKMLGRGDLDGIPRRRHSKTTPKQRRGIRSASGND